MKPQDLEAGQYVFVETPTGEREARVTCAFATQDGKAQVQYDDTGWKGWVPCGRITLDEELSK